MFRLFIFLFLSLVFLEAKEFTSAPVLVFASGNNKFVLPEVLKHFNAKYPNSKVVIQYGATGDLAKSILDGVEYDIFLAADMQRAKSVYLAKKSDTSSSCLRYRDLSTLCAIR